MDSEQKALVMGCFILTMRNVNRKFILNIENKN